MENKLVDINPDDWESMLNLMENEANYPEPMVGKNENGENVIVEICKDHIQTRTHQKNDWVRVNIYYDDGNVEELYER